MDGHDSDNEGSRLSVVNITLINHQQCACEMSMGEFMV